MGQAEGNVTPRIPKRRSVTDRRQQIVEQAAEFFARYGFDAGTRDFARYLGTTQPLLYRYFPTKEALIREVYRAVYLDLWDENWAALLTDRTKTLRERLIEFYRRYTDKIMNSRWMRLYLYAGLKGVEINQPYIRLVEERILSRIITEFWLEQDRQAPETVGAEDMEAAWILQGGIFYFGVRRFVYDVPTYTDKDAMIANAVDMFLAGYGDVMRRRLG
ncbi:MAG TPA: TetR/AcrR family transcriptional regulator [Stellaceae bacterium]|nr:TetR/AcrR family transcriptional regulator [Stellaceae bacterium]